MFLVYSLFFCLSVLSSFWAMNGEWCTYLLEVGLEISFIPLWLCLDGDDVGPIVLQHTLSCPDEFLCFLLYLP